MKNKKIVKQRIDDTNLEWYGLTEDDLEKIKENTKEDTLSKELLLASEIAEIFYLRFGIDIDIDQIISFIRKNKLLEKYLNAKSIVGGKNISLK